MIIKISRRFRCINRCENGNYVRNWWAVCEMSKLSAADRAAMIWSYWQKCGDSDVPIVRWEPTHWPACRSWSLDLGMIDALFTVPLSKHYSQLILLEALSKSFRCRFSLFVRFSSVFVGPMKIEFGTGKSRSPLARTIFNAQLFICRRQIRMRRAHVKLKNFRDESINSPRP